MEIEDSQYKISSGRLAHINAYVLAERPEIIFHYLYSNSNSIQFPSNFHYINYHSIEWKLNRIKKKADESTQYFFWNLFYV